MLFRSLDYFDRRGITVRRGDLRRVVARGPVIVNLDGHTGGLVDERQLRVRQHLIIGQTEVAQGRADTANEHAADDRSIDHETCDQDTVASADLTAFESRLFVETFFRQQQSRQNVPFFLDVLT